MLLANCNSCGGQQKSEQNDAFCCLVKTGFGQVLGGLIWIDLTGLFLNGFKVVIGVFNKFTLIIMSGF